MVCVAYLRGQVMPERDGMGPEGTGGEPIHLDDVRALSGIHGDLRAPVKTGEML